MTRKLKTFDALRARALRSSRDDPDDIPVLFAILSSGSYERWSNVEGGKDETLVELFFLDNPSTY